MTILVTGATGNVGRHVVASLRDAGYDVRVLTRRPQAVPAVPGVRVLAGDLRDPATLRPALSGVDRLFLFPVPDTAGHVTDLAVAAGVRRVVTLSSVAAEYADGDYSGDHHRPIEQAVERSGIAWTHLRPGEFMVNYRDRWGPSIRAEDVVRAPYGDVRAAPVHEADVADAAVAALLTDGHEYRRYAFTGPESLSKYDLVATLGRELGRPIAFHELTPPQAREMWLAQGLPPAFADWLLTDTESMPAGPTTEPITGRPPRTFADWVRDHRADFRRHAT